MKFDDVFVHIGDFGKFQIVMVMLIMITISWPSANISNIYTLVELPFKCKQNTTSHMKGDTNLSLRVCSHEPITRNQSTGFVPHQDTDTTLENVMDDQCMRCTDTGDIEGCTEWEFDHSLYGRTHVEKLICDRSWLRAFANTVFLLGMAVGGQIFGPLADKIGRVRTFVIGALVLQVSYLLSIFTTSYPVFVIARLFTGIGQVGHYNIAFLYAMEIIGPSQRMTVGVTCSLMYSLGYMLLSGLAYLLKDAMYVELVCVLPAMVKFLFIFAPESPRWLLVNGKQQQAEQVLNNMLKMNKPESTETINVADITVVQNASKQQGTMLAVLKSSRLRTNCLVLILLWMSTQLIVVALAYNSQALLPCNFILTNALLATMEIPGSLIGNMLSRWHRTGRRLTCTIGMIMAGICSFLNIPFILFDYPGVAVGLMICGKVFLNMVIVTITVYTNELFPTEVRSSAFGACTSFGRAGSLFASFTGKELTSVWLPLPYVVFGFFGTISGSLCLLLPETLNRKLTETMQEVEEQNTSDKSDQTEASVMSLSKPRTEKTLLLSSVE